MSDIDLLIYGKRLPLRGDFIDKKVIEAVFDGFSVCEGDQIDWADSTAFNQAVCIQEYCCFQKKLDYKINVFSFRYPYYGYERELIRQIGGFENPLLDYIHKLAAIIHVENYPYYDEFQNYFSFENGKLKVYQEICLTDPLDENDDGHTILMFEDMDLSVHIDTIDKFFKDAFLRDVALPEELNKPLSKLTEDEKLLLNIFLYK